MSALKLHEAERVTGHIQSHCEQLRQAVPNGWNYVMIANLAGNLTMTSTNVPDPGAPHVIEIARERAAAKRDAQHQASRESWLRVLADGDSSAPYMGESMAAELVSEGLVEKVGPLGYQLTDAGRAAAGGL